MSATTRLDKLAQRTAGSSDDAVAIRENASAVCSNESTGCATKFHSVKRCDQTGAIARLSADSVTSHAAEFD